MKIGISGAHSTGKSTFINRLKSELQKNNISFKVVGDLATICPLPILRQHTVESTLWIASKGISEELEAEHKYDVVIADRSILDCWAYFNAACKDRYEQTEPKLKTLKEMITHWLPTYDSIYLTVIDNNIPIENNKGRDLDPEYRKKIEHEMNDAALLFGAQTKKLEYSNAESELAVLLNRIKG